jgi:hypothetical protein
LDQEDLGRFKIPNSAFWHYPAVRLDSTYFLPSDIYEMDDPFLTHTLMKTIGNYLL